MDRRSFLAAGTTALASTALSYTRIPGANDRISLGHIGIGSRGHGLAYIASQLKDQKNVEMTAVCDLWKVNRERAAAAAGDSPRAERYRAPSSAQTVACRVSVPSRTVARAPSGTWQPPSRRLSSARSALAAKRASWSSSAVSPS